MPSFAYTARETATGREIRSTVEAANEQSAIAALLNRNLLVVAIQEKITKKGKTQGGRVALVRGQRRPPPRQGRYRARFGRSPQAQPWNN